MPESRGRFAPSTTGRAHPGTLFAALLCWLDARHRGGEVVLRLEDLDRTRTKAGYVDAMTRDLAWLGLDWDAESRQSEQIARYEGQIDVLARAGRVYACDCTRSQIRAAATRAPDGSFRYAGTCRDRAIAAAAWRTSELPLRLRLEDRPVEVRDESGLDLSGNPAQLFGDPLLRRRDGAYAYHLVSVVDDERDGIDRVVRGRDLAPSTTLQAEMRALFGFASPSYRHHALLLESTGDKLSKFHGAVDMRELGTRYDARGLCGTLAHLAGLVAPGTRCRPVDLIAEFDWSRVTTEDVGLVWSSARGLERVARG